MAAPPAADTWRDRARLHYAPDGELRVDYDGEPNQHSDLPACGVPLQAQQAAWMWAGMYAQDGGHEAMGSLPPALSSGFAPPTEASVFPPGAGYPYPCPNAYPCPNEAQSSLYNPEPLLFGGGSYLVAEALRTYSCTACGRDFTGAGAVLQHLRDSRAHQDMPEAHEAAYLLQCHDAGTHQVGGAAPPRAPLPLPAAAGCSFATAQMLLAPLGGDPAWAPSWLAPAQPLHGAVAWGWPPGSAGGGPPSSALPVDSAPSDASCTEWVESEEDAVPHAPPHAPPLLHAGAPEFVSQLHWFEQQWGKQTGGRCLGGGRLAGKDGSTQAPARPSSYNNRQQRQQRQGRRKSDAGPPGDTGVAARRQGRRQAPPPVLDSQDYDLAFPPLRPSVSGDSDKAPELQATAEGEGSSQGSDAVDSEAQAGGIGGAASKAPAVLRVGAPVWIPALREAR